MKLYSYSFVPTLICEDAPVSRIEKPQDVLSVMEGAFDAHPNREQFWVIFLNRRNIVIGRHLLSLGSQNACIAHPREILRAVLMADACGFVCVHNHPSGDPSPSAPDNNITRLIREASKAIDLTFQDHIIIGDRTVDPMGKGYFSFREAGVV